MYFGGNLTLSKSWVMDEDYIASLSLLGSQLTYIIPSNVDNYY